MDDLSRYFEILEVPRGASLEEVKRAYRDLAQVWHPDRYGHNPRLRLRAEEKLKRINEAYQRLSTGLGYARPANPHSSPPAPTQPTHPPPAPPVSHTGEAPPWQSPPAPPEPPRSGPGMRLVRLATVALFGFGIYVLMTAYRPAGRRPAGARPSSAVAPAAATAADYDRLAKIKGQIRERVARKDAEFSRLEDWYSRGVPTAQEPAYRAAPERAQQEEREIEVLILAYNAAKKLLDARKPAPSP